MKIKNFTGFMLGNENAIHKIGASWLQTDSRVWVCPNLPKAKNILEESQKLKLLNPGPIWTTIYQVSGHNIVFDCANSGLLYTDTPTKLYVNRIVCVKMPEVITEEMLLDNAKQISDYYRFLNRREK